MKIRALAALLACGATLAAAPAAAQSFLGGSLGQSDSDEDVARGVITSGQVDGKDTAWKLFAGYQAHRNFGFEAAYVDLGRTTYSGDFFGAPVTDGRIDIWGYNLAGIASLPLGERFALFGKLGLFLWESDASDVTGGAVFSSTTRGWDRSFGLGASFRFTRSLSARAEWEQFKIGGADASLLSLGVQYSF